MPKKDSKAISVTGKELTEESTNAERMGIDIPFVEDSEIGSADMATRKLLLQKLADDGRAVPQDWLLVQLGGIKKASLHSMIRRYEFRMSTRSTMKGEKVIRIKNE